MHIYYDVITIPRSITSAPENIYGVISKYDNRFSYTSGDSFIRVNNTFDVKFTLDSNSYLCIDGRQTPINNNTTGTVTIVTSTSLFYFLFKTNNAANTPITGFCWLHENSKEFFGVAVRNVSTGQIDSMYFSDMLSSPKNTNYAIKRHAQFQLISPNIVFITTSILADNGGNYTVLQDLRSCSNVVFDSTISVSHSNYYAIGTNTLIRDDGG